MKYLFISIILLFVLCNVFAQSDPTNIDSLKRVLQIQKEDTNKVDILLELSEFYQWTLPDSAIPYAQEALQLATELKSEKREFDAYSTLEEAFSTNGNYSKALESALNAFHLSEKSNDSLTRYWGFLRVGGAYYYSGNYASALKYYMEGKLYQPKLSGIGKELLFGFIGQAYFGLNEMDSALLYIQKCYQLDISSKDHWPVPYFYMAAIDVKKRHYSSALNYYREGVRISVVNLDLADGYVGMASVFQKSNLLDSAILYAQKALAVSKQASLLSNSIKASAILTEVYSGNHNIDSAFKYQSMMIALKDSLFSTEKIKHLENITFNEQMRQQDIRQKEKEYQNKLRIYLLIAALIAFLAIAIILFRNNRHKQKAFRILQKQKQEIDIQKAKVEQTLSELKSTQSQLIQSEKMASLGELTAGIAHEIQNPLNFVNNFSEVNKELIDELQQEMDKGNLDDAKGISNDIKENEEKINHHGQRAAAIVKGMLQHSRTSSGKKEPTDINALCDEYLRLSYHGMRAKDKSFNSEMKTDFDATLPKINVVPQDIGRVILNLINNAFYAASQNPLLGGRGAVPTVWVSTKKAGNNVFVSVKDNGPGIPDAIKDKIFQPFFTTKPTGQGTGLGLSLSYDIIKAHGGEIKVETKEGEFTKFIITLPS